MHTVPPIFTCVLRLPTSESGLAPPPRPSYAAWLPGRWGLADARSRGAVPSRRVTSRPPLPRGRGRVPRRILRGARRCLPVWGGAAGWGRGRACGIPGSGTQQAAFLGPASLGPQSADATRIFCHLRGYSEAVRRRQRDRGCPRFPRSVCGLLPPSAPRPRPRFRGCEVCTQQRSLANSHARGRAPSWAQGFGRGAGEPASLQFRLPGVYGKLTCAHPRLIYSA